MVKIKIKIWLLNLFFLNPNSCNLPKRPTHKSNRYMTCKLLCLFNASKGDGVPILSCCKSFSVHVSFYFSFVLAFKKQQNPYEIYGVFLFLLPENTFRKQVVFLYVWCVNTQATSSSDTAFNFLSVTVNITLLKAKPNW